MNVHARGVCSVALAVLASCDPVGRPRVPVEVAVQGGAPSELAAGGGTLHLERAELGLGALYLRAPKDLETVSALGRLRAFVIGTARAHGPGHAQTLREGQVLGELIAPQVLDALDPMPVALGEALVEDLPVERVSVTLEEARSDGALTRGAHARVAGFYERDGQRTPFDCTLIIAGDADDTPENLVERRRVDQIRLDAPRRPRAGASYVLGLAVERWLELVDWDEVLADDVRCAPGSPFMAAFYLGLRRPEAFSIRFVNGEDDDAT
jgi:hypothetical protein